MQQWVISLAPSPGGGTHETSLPGYCLWATALGAQHCYQISCSAAQGSQCYPVPWSTAQEHRKPYTRSLTNLCCLSPLTQRLPPTSERSHPGFCLLLAPGLSQGHWVSLVPTLVKYVESRQKLRSWFCMSRPCNKQERSVPGPIYAIGVREKVDIWEMIWRRNKWKAYVFLLNLAEGERRGCQEVWNKVSCCFCNCLIGQNNSLLQGDPLLRLQQGNAIQNEELRFLNKPIVFIALPFYAIAIIA